MTLQEWMDREEIKDAELASMVGDLSRSQINRIRQGESRPSLKNARKLSELTGIPAGDFLTGDAGAKQAAA